MAAVKHSKLQTKSMIKYIPCYFGSKYKLCPSRMCYQYQSPRTKEPQQWHHQDHYYPSPQLLQHIRNRNQTVTWYRILLVNSTDSGQTAQVSRQVWAYDSHSCHMVNFYLEWLVCNYDGLRLLNILKKKSLTTLLLMSFILHFCNDSI